ncbi:MAG: metallophosphoesterase [Solirubrobacterales bacterium]|nr:metallophosphoesterase [Solirubrobacterales bacterium]
MKIAALYDIHGNLAALDAVLAEVEAGGVDLIVVGGDVAAGPMPVETLDRLIGLGDRARFVMGNADRELVQAFDAGARPEDAKDTFTRQKDWAASRLDRAHRDLLAAFEPTVTAGGALFCHGSPRSDTEIVTTLSADERVAPMLDGVREDVVVGGHTHRQFDRRIGAKRLLNAGSVGAPYEGEAAAFWLLLAPEPELRRTHYDVEGAIATLRATGYPDFDEGFKESLLEPADPDWVAEYFEQQALGHG